MFQALTGAFRDTPRLGWLLVATLLAVLGTLAIWRVSRRRLSRSHELQRGALAGDWQPLETVMCPASRRLELAAVFAPLLVFATTITLVEQARDTILQGTHIPDQLRAEALLSELAGTAVGLVATMLLMLFAAFASGLAAAGRVRINDLLQAAALRAREPAAASRIAAAPGTRAPVLVAIIVGSVALAIGPMALAGVIGSVELLGRWYALAELEPSSKLQQWDAALRAARDTLDQGFSWSVAGTAIATAVGGALARKVPARTSRSDLVCVAGLWLLAGLLVALAEPMRRENATAWPAGTLQALRTSATMPHLAGPDALGGGPLVEVTRDTLTLDRVAASTEDLEAHLERRTREFHLLHPKEKFTGSVLLICGHDTPIERLSAVLGRLARAGYRQPTFVFETRHESDRPVLGRVVLHRVSGARVTLVHAAVAREEGVVLINPAETSTCAELCDRVAAARRHEHAVSLIVPYQP